MKKYCLAIFLMLLGLTPSGVMAATPPALEVPVGLALAEIKITGNEFLLLQNNTGGTISDLSKYWLYAFNNVNPLAVGVSSSLQQLPPGALASGQTVLLSANGGSTCGAAITAKLSLSLSDSGGFLEVVQTSLVGGVLLQTAGDAVSWSSGVNSAVGMITKVPSNSSAPNGAYYRYKNPATTDAAYLWQQADLDSGNSCQLNVLISGVATPGPTNPGNQLLPGDPPPATIISLSDDGAQTQDSPAPAVGLPLSDVGLAAPQINEVLPNPAEPQTDSEDEFIELYNSNDKTFDLSGFKLQTGTTTLHNYSFPAGTMLAPKSFTAFFSVDTNLSLSNSSGQAQLLDPFGNSISQTEIYSLAKDGQSWALADGKWYWTSSPTSGAANIIVQPLSVKSLSVGSAPANTTSISTATNKSSTPAVKTAAAAAPKAKAASTTTASNTSSNNKSAPVPTPRNLHPLVLAGVGAVAVGYAAYEYHNDLANRFHQLRRYRETRRTARKPS